MTSDKSAKHYEKYKSHMLEKIICNDCKKKFCRSSKANHLRSKYHLDAVKDNCDDHDDHGLEFELLNLVRDFISKNKLVKG